MLEPELSKIKVGPVHGILVNGVMKTAPEIKLGYNIIDNHNITSIHFIDKKADRHNIVLGMNEDVVYFVSDVLIYNGW